ncbi:MAG: hypothetical protein M3Q99_15195, partial [Acidobacteriota bacterium]|nr:hypothetical protein [Acidobacteriota bacterium]
YKKALNDYEEALEINKKLAQNTPKYIPVLAANFINLGAYYQTYELNRDKSIEYILESLLLVTPLIEKVSYTQKYYLRALQILYNWGLNDEQIQNLINKHLPENN